MRLRLTSAIAVMLTLAVGFANGDVLLTDDFSDNDYTSNPAWVVDSGVFAADGTPIGVYYGSAGAGMLAFGTTAGTSIHLNLPQVEAGTPLTIEFDHFQSNYAHPSGYHFAFSLKDSQSSQVYSIKAHLATGYYGASGFSSYTATGNYAAGTTGKSLLNGWRHVKIAFDPTAGVSMYYAGDLVSTFTNFKNLASVDQLVLTNTGGTVSWFVDNVVVSGTPVPEPATMSLLVAGAIATLIRRRAQ